MPTIALPALAATDSAAPRRHLLLSRDAWGRAAPAGIFVGLVYLRGDTLSRAFDGLLNASSTLGMIDAGLLLLFVLLSSLFYVFVAALFLGRHTPRATKRGLWATILAFAGAWGTAPFAFLPVVNAERGWTIAANCLTVVGIAASCFALCTLGRHFGVRPSARGVVSHGIYRHIRHPLYTFEAIAQLGILLVVLSPLAVSVFVVYLALQFGRAIAEEQLLAATFPAYREYMARTSRFIPGLV